MNRQFNSTDTVTSTVASAHERELLKAGNEYDTLCALLGREYGIDLRAMDKSIVERKCRQYVDKYKLFSLAECLDFIACDQARLQELGDVIYSQSTYFNRQPDDFKFVIDTMIHGPGEVLADETDTLNVWSLGCSTGQEVYTIAVYLMERLGDCRSSRFRVRGSDCSYSAIEKARAGRYKSDDVRRLEPIDYSKYFAKSDRQDELLARPELCQHVTFSPFNLVTSDYKPHQDFACVFLRNAIDFHTPESKALIMTNVRGALRNGGYLILGEDPGIGRRDMWGYGYELIGDGRYQAAVG
jgi:chemotaxis protein methyltransferase CheR